MSGLESDWLRRSIWDGICLCSSHSNPNLKIIRNVGNIRYKQVYIYMYIYILVYKETIMESWAMY
jgi:hypothetical protein